MAMASKSNSSEDVDEASDTESETDSKSKTKSYHANGNANGGTASWRDRTEQRNMRAREREEQLAMQEGRTPSSLQEQEGRAEAVDRSDSEKDSCYITKRMRRRIDTALRLKRDFNIELDLPGPSDFEAINWKPAPFAEGVEQFVDRRF